MRVSGNQVSRSESTHSGIQDTIECPYLICTLYFGTINLLYLLFVWSLIYNGYIPPGIYQIWRRCIRERTHTQIYIRFGDDVFENELTPKSISDLATRGFENGLTPKSISDLATREFENGLTPKSIPDLATKIRIRTHT